MTQTATRNDTSGHDVTQTAVTQRDNEWVLSRAVTQRDSDLGVITTVWNLIGQTLYNVFHGSGPITSQRGALVGVYHVITMMQFNVRYTETNIHIRQM